MQITRETDYAIRCVLHLSERPDRIAMVDEISKDREIPKSFLAKILQKLSKANIVKSFRGIRGGFKLATIPGKISLLSVIEAIEGPIAMNRCAINKNLCKRSNACSAHPVWVNIRKDIEERLRQCTFDDLVNP